MILDFQTARLRDRSPELDRSWRAEVYRRLERRRLKRVLVIALIYASAGLVWLASNGIAIGARWLQ